MARYGGKEFIGAQIRVFFRDIGHALRSMLGEARDPETRIQIERWIDSLKHHTEWRFSKASVLGASAKGVVTGYNVAVMDRHGRKLKNIITVAVGKRFTRDDKLSILHEMAHNVFSNEAIADMLAAKVAARIGSFQSARNKRIDSALARARARREKEQVKRFKGVKEYYRLAGSDLIELDKIVHRDVMLRVPLMHNPFTQARNIKAIIEAEKARRKRLAKRRE